MRFSGFKYLIFASFSFILTSIFSVNAQIAGSPDTTFGTNGVAGSTLRQTAAFSDLAVQADKKIVVIGTTNDLGNPTIYNTVARFNENGTLDTTFSGDGYNDALNFTGVINRVALQADGKIVVVGTSPAGHFAVLRLNTNGTLDTSFDSDGIVTTTFGDHSEGNSVNITSDGKIVVAGLVTQTGATNSDFGLIRYNSDGSLDTSFGTNGKVVTQLNGNEWANDSFIQPNGKVIAVGRFSDLLTGQVKAPAIRYNTDGSLDGSFGTGGIMYKNSADATRAALQNNGMFVMVGSGMVSRFYSNGTPDIDISSAIVNPNTVAVQPDGKILIGGATPTFLNILQKFNRNGSLDPNFGSNGTIITNYTVKKVALAPDNKIVAGGQRFVSAVEITLGRYTNRLFNPMNMFDFDGDTKSDITVYRPHPTTAGTWYGLHSSNNNFWQFYWGNPGHKTVPADFDGDGKIDTWHYSVGVWYGYNSTTNIYQYVTFPWGVVSDTPMSADYNGDGTADYCLYRSSTGEWRCVNQVISTFFGTSGDRPLMGDFDGDLKADIAVYRPSNGYWYWLKSSNGQFTAIPFGIATDIPVPADYDGDGKTDVAVYRDGIWYRLNSSDFSFAAVSFGTATDKPAPADYDGDGKADVAVYRPNEGNWYLLKSTTGFAAVRFGSSGDLPIPNAFIR